MVIDVHTHAFPDAIAERTLEFLKAKMLAQSNIKVPNNTDGTVDGLLRSMDKCGVDISLVMPIATKISQTNTINNFAENLRGERILSFGSVHPHDSDACDVLKDLASRGFMGIKLHPEFQDFYIDSKESLKVLKCAEELGLSVLIHAGGDLGYPPPYHCTPERLEHVLGEISGEKLIAAHLGGFMMWDEVLKRIAGKPIYIDTAAVGTCITPDIYHDIIRAHGADRVLFGSDSPWESQSHALEVLESTGITKEELDKIKYENAVKLFGLKKL
ncbi:MAG: amidohydrolase family protein [Clostridia bacterium]|nr:amidohydrolase family protein [Clostridia bacterium]